MLTFVFDLVKFAFGVHPEGPSFTVSDKVADPPTATEGFEGDKTAEFILHPGTGVSVFGALEANVAVTDLLVDIETVQLPVPLQPPPLQPVNTEPEEGEADRTTLVPLE